MMPSQEIDDTSGKFDFGMDNLGFTKIQDDSDSEIDSERDSGFQSTHDLRKLRHKDSIVSLVSCASFSRERFLDFIGKDESETIIKKDRRFSFQQDFTKPLGRYSAFLFNRFGYNGSEQQQLRNGTGIYHICNGSVLVTDVLNSCLLVYGSSGRLVNCVPVSKGSEPWTASATPCGKFAVAVGKHKCISVLTCTGVEKRRIGEGNIKMPSGIIVDRRNRYIVSDIKLNKILIFSDEGELIRPIPDNDDCPPLKVPRHVTLSHSGDIIVSDSGNHCIRIFDRHGEHIRSFGKYGVEDGQLKSPHGVCADVNDNIIVCDYYNNRISMFSKYGQFLQHLVTASMGLHRPQAVTIRHNPSHFILYITYGDMKANKIVAYRIVDSQSDRRVTVCTKV